MDAHRMTGLQCSHMIVSDLPTVALLENWKKQTDGSHKHAVHVATRESRVWKGSSPTISTPLDGYYNAYDGLCTVSSFLLLSKSLSGCNPETGVVTPTVTISMRDPMPIATAVLLPKVQLRSFTVDLQVVGA